MRQIFMFFQILPLHCPTVNLSWWQNFSSTHLETDWFNFIDFAQKPKNQPQNLHKQIEHFFKCLIVLLPPWCWRCWCCWWWRWWRWYRWWRPAADWLDSLCERWEAAARCSRLPLAVSSVCCSGCGATINPQIDSLPIELLHPPKKEN